MNGHEISNAKIINMIVQQLHKTIKKLQLENILSIEYHKNSEITLLSIGKMAEKLTTVVRDKINLNNSFTLQIEGYQPRYDFNLKNSYYLSHPIPDSKTFEIVKYVLSQIKNDNPKNLLVLISGGGSAALALPEPEISDQIYIKIIGEMYTESFTIYEMNQIRSIIDQCKAGKLLSILPESNFNSIVISDVPGDDLSIIASGPTVPGTQITDKIIHWLRNFGERLNIQKNIKTLIDRYQSQLELSKITEIKARSVVDQVIKLTTFRDEFSNLMASLGFSIIIRKQDLSRDLFLAIDEVIEVSKKLVRNEICLWVGEPKVPLKNIITENEGGRISSLTLGISIKLQPNQIFCGFATDGRDGTSVDNFYMIDNKSLNLDLDQIKNKITSGVSGKFLREKGLSRNLGRTNLNFSDLYFLIDISAF